MSRFHSLQGVFGKLGKGNEVGLPYWLTEVPVPLLDRERSGDSATGGVSAGAVDSIALGEPFGSGMGKRSGTEAKVGVTFVARDIISMIQWVLVVVDI